MIWYKRLLLQCYGFLTNRLPFLSFSPGLGSPLVS